MTIMVISRRLCVFQVLTCWPPVYFNITVQSQTCCHNGYVDTLHFEAVLWCWNAWNLRGRFINITNMINTLGRRHAWSTQPDVFIINLSLSREAGVTWTWTVTVEGARWTGSWLRNTFTLADRQADRDNDRRKTYSKNRITRSVKMISCVK